MFLFNATDNRNIRYYHYFCGVKEGFMHARQVVTHCIVSQRSSDYLISNISTTYLYWLTMKWKPWEHFRKDLVFSNWECGGSGMLGMQTHASNQEAETEWLPT